MLILKRKICKCGKKALPNRRVCYFCDLAIKKANREASQARQKARKQAKDEKLHNSLAYLKPIAWKLFSRHIRYSNLDSYGRAKCYTCGFTDIPQNMQAGHFHHDRLDFSEKNVHVQCVRCNKWLSGNLGVYAERLVEDGVDLKVLRRDAESKVYTVTELKELIATLSK